MRAYVCVSREGEPNVGTLVIVYKVSAGTKYLPVDRLNGERQSKAAADRILGSFICPATIKDTGNMVLRKLCQARQDREYWREALWVLFCRLPPLFVHSFIRSFICASLSSVISRSNNTSSAVRKAKQRTRTNYTIASSSTNMS